MIFITLIYIIFFYFPPLWNHPGKLSFCMSIKWGRHRVTLSELSMNALIIKGSVFTSTHINHVSQCGERRGLNLSPAGSVPPALWEQWCPSVCLAVAGLSPSPQRARAADSSGWVSCKGISVAEAAFLAPLVCCRAPAGLRVEAWSSTGSFEQEKRGGMTGEQILARSNNTSALAKNISRLGSI